MQGESCRTFQFGNKAILIMQSQNKCLLGSKQNNNTVKVWLCFCYLNSLICVSKLSLHSGQAGEKKKVLMRSQDGMHSWSLVHKFLCIFSPFLLAFMKLMCQLSDVLREILRLYFGKYRKKQY